MTPKLSTDQIHEARARLAAGETHRSIAASMGVGRSTITDLATGRSWSWIP